jgi:hypothetical protein
MKAALIVLGVLIAAPAWAETPTRVEQLEWMVGDWIDSSDGRTMEAWAVKDGALIGGSFAMGAKGLNPRERMRIDARDGTLVFVASIAGQPDTEFRVVGGDEQTVTFENKLHDFPQAVTYAICGRELCATIKGTVGGQARRKDWRFTKPPPALTPPPPPPAQAPAGTTD